MNATKLCAKAQLIKEYEHDIHAEAPIRGRTNTGGIRIKDSFNIIDSLSLDTSLVADVFFIIADIEIEKTVLSPDVTLDVFISCLEWFSCLASLSSISEYQLLHLKQPKGISNEGINKRNIQSSMKC